MKELPITFSGPMVRAILEGRKTQTRRVIRSQFEVGVSVQCDECQLRKKPIGRSAPLEMANSLCDHECPGYRKTPPPGDLWPGESRAEFGYGFRACPYGVPGDRLWVRETHALEITDVREERVQEISEDDAILEGAPPYDVNNRRASYIPWFSDLWDSINGKKPGRAWADNPWVWVIEFRKVDP